MHVLWLFSCAQSKFVEELAQQGRIRELILDQYANYVVQRALTVANNEEGLKLVAAIRPHLHSMQVRSLPGVLLSCPRVYGRVVQCAVLCGLGFFCRFWLMLRVLVRVTHSEKGVRHEDIPNNPS